jgi:tensin
MFKMCTSVESWTDADPRNIAVIHCLTGKGRTAVIVACVLTWMGEFSSPMEALQYTADRRKVPVESLTIPSQRRYIQYFSNVLDGVKPRAEPLLLRRIIMNGTPGYCVDPTWKDADGGEEGTEGPTTLGCCPYIQLFKNGRLMASALATAPSNPRYAM